jgi:AcrR family transcriptional regulator
MLVKKKKNSTKNSKIEFKKRDRATSTKQILQAALKVFSKVGYDAATTKIIAKQADLNESLIQRYFKSKANLLIEVTEISVEALKKEIYYAPELNPEEEIYHFLINKLKHDIKNQNFLRVLISRLLVDNKLRRDLHRRKKSPPDLFFRERLVAFQKNGLIKDDIVIDELVISIVAQSMSVGLIERILFNKSVADCERQFRIFAKNLTQGICQ